jgi:uncharacterized repeat protein (TIGR01451 family)
MRILRRQGRGSVLAAIGLGLVLLAPGAQAASPVASASAEAYGLFVDVKLLPAQVPVTLGPRAWSAQESPPGSGDPSEHQELEAGPVPADSSLVDHIGVMNTGALADAPPSAGAFASAADVSLLGAGENAAITADEVTAQSFSNCEDAPSGRVTFVNLVVNGTPIDETPAPNTVIDLTVAKVILNEQHPAFDGRGFVVNAIHVISTTTGDPLFRGDIIVSHAMSTVNCPNAAPGTTGGDNLVKMTKTVTPTSTTAGKNVTYTATFTNNSDVDCLVTEAIDHLPAGFELVSTAGDLGDTSTTRQRPESGIDVLAGNGVTIAAGKSATQTYVVKVGDSVKPGTYFNDVELFCANLGNFIKGLDAPVEITAAAAPTTTTAAPTTTTPTGQLPETGGSHDLAVLGGAGLILAGIGVRLRRLTAS